MTNPLMNLRLAYLRAVAKAWMEEDFKNKLLKADDILPILVDEKEFGFESPWTLVELKLVDDKDRRTEWHPRETAGWIGSDDKFVINFPDKPRKGQGVRALAAYYQLFPTLFGPEKDKKIGGALPLDLGVSPEPFLKFGGVTLRAIALAWKDEDFKKELANDATHALSRYLGYRSPWNFGLQFIKNEFDKYFKWDERTGSWVAQKKEDIPKNRIELHFPVKPDVNEEYLPIALTSYNNTGPEYPFSCA